MRKLSLDREVVAGGLSQGGSAAGGEETVSAQLASSGIQNS